MSKRTNLLIGGGLLAAVLTLGTMSVVLAQSSPGVGAWGPGAILRGSGMAAGMPMSGEGMPGGHGGMMQGHGPGMDGNGGMMAGLDMGQHFIQEMIPHHQDAVAMADLAAAQAEHPELRGFAENVKRVQSEEITRMREWYRAWYGTDVPPSMMGDAMSGMGGQEATPLDGARPFDKAFIEQMIPHHEMALMMSNMALRGVDRPELRELLQSIITSQSAEIDQMRAWYQQWYGVPVPSTAGMMGHQMEPTRHDEVRARGASVMPFDLNQTTHRFVTLPDGGLQSVTATDPANLEQIGLIQTHLAEEASRFQHGDFSDPAAIHGHEMPGLAELAASAPQIEVVYTPLPDGGQIRYTSQDLAAVDALHRWFAAQLADHGRDAQAR